MQEKNEEEIIKIAEEKAKEELKNVIREEAIGYMYYFNLKKKEILKKYGIEWKIPRDKNYGKSID